jgi:hypothetical protein
MEGTPLLMGVEEIRNVLLSGAVVGAHVCPVAKNPSFVHPKPVLKLDRICITSFDLVIAGSCVLVVGP